MDAYAGGTFKKKKIGVLAFQIEIVSGERGLEQRRE